MTDLPGPGEPVAEDSTRGERRRRGPWRWWTSAPWWVHVVVTLGVFVIAFVAAAATAAALFVDYVRERGPLASEIPVQTALTGEDARGLAERFAPEIRYDSRELFVPIPRSAYVSRTQLKEQEGRFVRILEKIATEAKLPEKLGTCLRGCFLFLDVRGVEPDPPKQSQRAYDAIENKLLRSGAKPTAYYHVVRYEDTGDIAVQYWFLYFFNFRLNEHESDWEQVTVQLDENEEPQNVFYSSHESGETAPWSEIRKAGTHPLVFPARGSHANYFRPGRHEVAISCKRVIGSIRRCLRGRKFVADVSDGHGRTLVPGEYDIQELTGPVYAGSYGSGNYVVLTRKASVLSDPRLRLAWRDPLRPLR